MSRQVKATLDNVAGVRIPKFEKVGEGHDTNMALTGLGSGGKAIQACPHCFQCSALPEPICRSSIDPHCQVCPLPWVSGSTISEKHTVRMKECWLGMPNVALSGNLSLNTVTSPV